MQRNVSPSHFVGSSTDASAVRETCESNVQMNNHPQKEKDTKSLCPALKTIAPRMRQSSGWRKHLFTRKPTIRIR